MPSIAPAIEVSVTTRYLREQSAPDQARYSFSYTITLRNVGNVAARLLSRQWIVRDASGHTEEIRGDGVVGQHPHLQPGESFQYSSGTVIATPVGTMQGSYRWQLDGGREFDTPIPEFTLSGPRTLH